MSGGRSIPVRGTRSAISEASRLQPDVILLDLAMPRRTGLEVLPELREKAPEAKIIDAADSQFLILGSAIAGVDALAQTLQVWTLRGTQWLRLGVDTGHG